MTTVINRCLRPLYTANPRVLVIANRKKQVVNDSWRPGKPPASL